MTALQVHAAHEAESCGFPQKTPLQDRPGGHPVHALPMLCTGAGRALTEGAGRATGPDRSPAERGAGRRPQQRSAGLVQPRQRSEART